MITLDGGKRYIVELRIFNFILAIISLCNAFAYAK